MPSISLALKLLAPAFIAVALIHLVFGLSAEVMLGAQLSADSLTDPALDSQNRFYGVAFAIYGVLFYVCSNDILKYKTILYCLLWVFFAAGVSRFVSMALLGTPGVLIGVLLVAEILFPPIMMIWLYKAVQGNSKEAVSP